MKYHTTALILVFLFFVPWLGYSQNEDFTKQLSFGGYISTYFDKNNIDNSNPLAYSIASDPTFVVSKVVTFVESKFAPKWRFFGEIEFTYTPSGYSSVASPTASSEGQIYQNPLTLLSQQNDGLIIQRAFVDYTWNDLLSFRVGQYLTPFGIWNEDHGDPILTSISLPYSVTALTYAQAQAGAGAFGKWFASDSVVLSYNVYTGNGDGTQPFGANPGGVFAFGGRVQSDLFDMLTLNGSYYNGDTTYGLAGTYPGKFAVTSAVNHSTFGGGLKFAYASLVLQSELIHDTTQVKTGPLTDGVQDLFYVQAEYTILDILTPYTRYERDILSRFTANISTNGINIHILPQVVFKTDFAFVNWESTKDGLKDFSRVAAGLTVLF